MMMFREREGEEEGGSVRWVGEDICFGQEQASLIVVGWSLVFQDADSDAIDEDDIPPPPKRARTSTAGRSGATSVARSGTNTPAEMVLRAIGEFMLCSECEKQFTVVSWWE